MLMRLGLLELFTVEPATFFLFIYYLFLFIYLSLFYLASYGLSCKNFFFLFWL